MRRVLALWVVLGSAASAQVESGGLATVCRLPASPQALGLPASVETAATSYARRAAPTCDPATEGARFEVTYTGFPPGAEASFQEAVDVWACRVRSDQIIRISATWGPLDPGTLGSAGPLLYRNFQGAPARDIWYPAALADHLSGRDLGDGAADVEAVFNSDFTSWHTGSGPPPSGLYDLTTVVLHELGHGLGFIGSLTVQDGVGRVGPETDGPFSYDLYTQSADGTPLLDSSRYPDGSAALKSALEEQVTFQGRATDQAVGSPLALFSPSPFVLGGSYSHLDEQTFPANTPDGLMTPFIARNEQVLEPGTAVCAVLADVGWTLAGDCARRVGTLAPLSGEVQIVRRGSNPFSGLSSVEIQSESPVSLTATLVDVLGRKVQNAGRRIVSANQPWTLTLDGRGLASGVYVLVVRGGTEVERAAFTVAR